MVSGGHPTFSIGHNGGPALDSAPTPSAQSIIIGEKYMRLFEPARHYAYFGGRGSGKSWAIVIYLVTVASQERKRIVCARQFQNSIKDSVKELIENTIISMGLQDQFMITDREIEHRKTGSRFTFIGLDRNPDSAKSLEGADICFVEEARTINDRSMEILIPTIRKPGSKIIWAWNPEFRTDPVDKYFRGPVLPPDSIIEQVGIEDNPFFYHTPLATEMRYMKQANPKRFEHVWMGGYDDGYESRIFSDIVIGKVARIPETVPALYGMDFGFGSDPSVVTKSFLLKKQKILYIEKAVFGRVPLASLPSLMDAVVDSRDDLIKGDSSQPGTIEHLQSKGFNIVGAKKGPGSVKSGINFLQGFKIVINPELEEMRNEARLYSWMIDKITKKVIPVPMDTNNHGWDSVRYATESAQVEADEDDGDDGVIRINFKNRRRA